MIKTNKKGQVTVFLIVGIVLIAIAGMILFINKMGTVESLSTGEVTQRDPVQSYIEDCLEEKLEEAIVLVALQGGSYGIPENSVELTLQGSAPSIYVPYYYTNEEIRIPNKDNLKEVIRTALEDNADECLDLEPFEEYDVKVNEEKNEFEVMLSEKRVNVIAKLPIDLIIGDSEEIVSLDLITTSLDKFQVSVDSDILSLSNIASDLTKEQQKNEDLVCISCLDEIGRNNNLEIETYEVEKEEDVVMFYFLKPKDEDIVYNFAHKFPITEPEILSVEKIDNSEAIVGTQFLYPVKAYGKNLEFSDDSILFDITNEGLISFIPSNDEIGEHLATITVKDSKGDVEEELFTLNVTKYLDRIKINEIGVLTASVGEEFSYEVELFSLDDSLVEFSDNIDLFEIDKETGMITFIPSDSDVGEHLFTITAVDELGNSVSVEGELRILSE